MASSISIGLVGCGAAGQRLLADLLQLGAEVIVADPDEENRFQGIRLGATEAVPSLAELPRTKALVVSAPASDLEDVLLEVVERNIPVLTERALTANLSGAARLAQLAPKQLFVLQAMRYHPGIAGLASIVSRNELGSIEWLRLTRTSWNQPTQAPDAAWTLFSQDLAIVLEVLGEIPPPVFAVPEVLEGVVRGIFAVLGEAPAPRVLIEDSTRYSDNRREVRLHGTKGVAVLPDISSGHIEITMDQDSRAGAGLAAPQRRAIAPGPASPQIVALKAFLDHARNRRRARPRSSAEDSLTIVRTIDHLRTLAGR